MYAYIKGILAEFEEDSIVIENQGIGYLIRVPARVLSAIGNIGSEVKVYTYLHVREEEFSLFGFLSKEELRLFQLLITVSGIGPKNGLAMLSVLSPSDISFAIASEDVKTISSVPGIGPKTAKRLIIELKDKIDLSAAIEDLSSDEIGPENVWSSAKAEAMEALTALGYSLTDARMVLEQIPADDQTDTETLLKEALKQMAFM